MFRMLGERVRRLQAKALELELAICLQWTRYAWFGRSTSHST